MIRFTGTRGDRRKAKALRRECARFAPLVPGKCPGLVLHSEASLKAPPCAWAGRPSRLVLRCWPPAATSLMASSHSKAVGSAEWSSPSLNRTAVDYLVRGKHTCVLWNSVPRDWADPVGWIDRALADVRAREHTVVVVHDLPSGAMAGLPRFLDELDSSGVAVTAELPGECVPIIGGRVVNPIDHLMPL